MEALIGSNRDNITGGRDCCLGNAGTKRWIWVRNLDDLITPHTSQKGTTDLKGKEPVVDRFMDSPERKLLVRNTSVKSMRKNFELCEIKTSTPSKDANAQLRNPFEKIDKCIRVKEEDNNEEIEGGKEKHESDSKEKEDVGRKRRQRLEEFLLTQEERSPAAKRAKTGTVYHTIKHFALSQDNSESEAVRKAMTPTESYQLLLSWINNRIKNYSAFVPQISDLSVATFNSGTVLAALAHSFNPFQTPFFQLSKRNREDQLTFAWDTFRVVTGEQPVYSLEDALSATNQKLDRKCLLAMLFLIREKVILQNLRQYNHK